MSELKKLGDLIDLIDERNKNGIIKTLIGVSIDKCFIKSVANTIGTDLSKYQIIRKFDFACNPMHVGRDERLPVALYQKDVPALVSPAYFMFKIKDDKIVVPEYLMLVFRRKDFDRNCWFRTDGNVRGGIAWNDICDMKLPVPPLEEQQKIVDAYNAVENRIKIKQKINEKLEATARCLFDKMTKDKEKNTAFEDIATINSGKRPENMQEGSFPLVGAGSVMGYISSYNYDDKTLVIGRVGTHGKVQRFNCKCWCSDNTLTIKSNFYEYSYFILKNIDYGLLNRGSTQPLITQTDIKNIPIFFEETEVKNFEKSASKLMNVYDLNRKELEKLAQLKQLIVSQIARQRKDNF
ncbi:restriction endonuclease subunit S [uncultured Treponema sp.]|uniref:restriction endonuclease subunit S n=1 Tax=uncultured Treponema sp. TaxID=162155 RepID=UPI0026379E65|nr:restriction endonuclease subunit S [uncultured Treponema sp.]